MSKVTDAGFWEKVKRDFDASFHVRNALAELGEEVSEEKFNRYVEQATPTYLFAKCHLVFATIALDRTKPSCENPVKRWGREVVKAMTVDDVLEYKFPETRVEHGHISGVWTGSLGYFVSSSIVSACVGDGNVDDPEKFTEAFVRTYVQKISDNYAKFYKFAFSESLHSEEYNELRDAVKRLWDRTFTPESRKRILLEYEKKEKKKTEKNTPENKKKQEEKEKEKRKKEKAQRRKEDFETAKKMMESCPVNPDLVRLLLDVENPKSLTWLSSLASILGRVADGESPLITSEEKQTMVDVASMAHITQM